MRPAHVQCIKWEKRFLSNVFLHFLLIPTHKLRTTKVILKTNLNKFYKLIKKIGILLIHDLKKLPGFYRVNYDTENWKRIIDYMNTPNFKNIHVLNRAKLLDDAYYFVTNSKLDANLLFNLTSYLVREDDLIPWKRAGAIFFYLIRSQGRTAENKVKKVKYY